MNPPNKHIQSVNNPLMRCVSTFDGSRTSAADYKLIPLKTKICTKCKIHKRLSEFYVWGDKKDRFDFYCKKCRNLGYLQSLRKAQIYQRINIKKWREEHKKEISEKGKLLVRNMSDSYIKKLLCFNTILEPSNIPQILIEAKREHIKINRLIRERYRK